MTEYKNQIFIYIPSWHCFPIIRNIEILCKIIGSTNQRKLDTKVIKEKYFKTFPLIFPRFWFILWRKKSKYLVLASAIRSFT